MLLRLLQPRLDIEACPPGFGKVEADDGNVVVALLRKDLDCGPSASLNAARVSRVPAERVLGLPLSGLRLFRCRDAPGYDSALHKVTIRSQCRIKYHIVKQKFYACRKQVVAGRRFQVGRILFSMLQLEHYYAQG
jgi:hypothetical protein